MESRFVLVVNSDFRKLFVDFGSHRGYFVVQHESFIVGEWVGQFLVQKTPASIPRQDLDLVQGEEIADNVAPDKPEPVHVKNAEFVGVHFSGAAHFPCFAGGKERVSWNIQWVEVDFQDACLEGVELRVYHHPAFLRRVPVFAYPMVYVLVRVEIGAEAAAGSGWDAFVAQKRNEEKGEVSAVAYLALVNGSWCAEGFMVFLGYVGEFF